jgi:hypothetical protein
MSEGFDLGLNIVCNFGASKLISCKIHTIPNLMHQVRISAINCIMNSFNTWVEASVGGLQVPKGLYGSVVKKN